MSTPPPTGGVNPFARVTPPEGDATPDDAADSGSGAAPAEPAPLEPGLPSPSSPAPRPLFAPVTSAAPEAPAAPPAPAGSMGSVPPLGAAPPPPVSPPSAPPPPASGPASAPIFTVPRVESPAGAPPSMAPTPSPFPPTPGQGMSQAPTAPAPHGLAGGTADDAPLPGEKLRTPRVERGERPARPTLGWAAIAASLVGLGPVGVVLGHLGWRAATRSGADPSLPRTGAILGYASTALVGAAAGLAILGVSPFGGGGPGDVPVITPPADAVGRSLDTSVQVADRWFGLAIGDCVAPFASGTTDDATIEQPEVVSCDVAHYGEVYAIADISGDALPDDQEFRSHTREVCEGTLFSSYVGVDYRASGIFYDVLYPAQRSWDAGTHQMVCLLVEPGGTTTGSLRSAGR